MGKKSMDDHTRRTYLECLEYTRRTETLRKTLTQSKEIQQNRKKIEKTVNEFKREILTEELHWNLDQLIL